MNFEFNAKSYRMLPCPYPDESEYSYPNVYEMFIEIQDLPDNFPMETNPREQNLGTKVAKAIKNSLYEADGTFYVKNRGIVLSAKDIEYDAKNKRVRISMDNTELHGNIDGGHTYRIILDERKDIEKEQYVKLEVITNAEGFFADLAASRNTSVQVNEKSIAELEGKFDPLKFILPDYIVKNTAWKQNGEERINVDTILAILSCFDINKYSDADEQPIKSYNGRINCVKTYLEYYDEDKKNVTNNNPILKMKRIIPDVLSIYNLLEVNYQKYYVDAFPNGKLGAIKCIGYKQGKKFRTELYDDEIDYKVPLGFIMPILSSFRCLVIEKDGEIVWRDKVDHKKYLELYGSKLVKFIIERFKTLGNNPNTLGKDAGVWRELYSFMFSEYKDRLLQELNIEI